MRRNSLLIGGWVVATALALVLGLQSVRAVSNSVTVHRPASLSPASVKAALQRADSESSSESSSESATSESSSSGVGQDSRSSSSSDSVAPSPTISRAPDDNGSGESGGSVSSSVASSSSSLGSDGLSGGDGGGEDGSNSSSTLAAQDKTYQLQGGSVGVRFENGAAHMLWATPNSGYTVETSNTTSTVEVRFLSADHESRLKAYWDNGPRAEIEDGD